MRSENSPMPDVSRREMPHEDVDRALTDYFRAEMPHPWPEAPRVKPTAAPRLPAAQAGSGWGSRFALAASIALILLGAWLVAGSFDGVGAPKASRFTGGDANRKHRLPAKDVREEMIQPPGGQTQWRITFPELP